MNNDPLWPLRLACKIVILLMIVVFGGLLLQKKVMGEISTKAKERIEYSRDDKGNTDMTEFKKLLRKEN